MHMEIGSCRLRRETRKPCVVCSYVANEWLPGFKLGERVADLVQILRVTDQGRQASQSAPGVILSISEASLPSVRELLTSLDIGHFSSTCSSADFMSVAAASFKFTRSNPFEILYSEDPRHAVTGMTTMGPIATIIAAMLRFGSAMGLGRVKTPLLKR